MIAKKQDDQISLERIIKEIPGNIYWMSTDNLFLGCNKQQAGAAGLDSPDEIIGKTNFEMPWKAYAEALNEVNAEVVRTKQAQKKEEKATMYGDDGLLAERYYLSHKIPIFSDRGEVQSVLGVSLDITELKLMEGRLKKALKDARKADTEREQMLDRMFNFVQDQEHDMRTAMSGLVMAADNLKSAREKGIAFDDELIGMLIDQVADSSRRVLDYQESLLFDLYDEETQGRTIFSRFDLNALVSHVFEFHQAAATAKQLTFSCHIDEAIPTYLKGDAKRVYQSLMDLLGNGIKFTEEGHVIFSVDYLGQKDDKTLIRFMVEDTGVGIPEEKQKDIYQAYVKLKRSNKGRSSGRGLGLTRIARYAELVGGELSFDSKAGEGSTFRLVLPFAASLDQTSD